MEVTLQGQKLKLKDLTNNEYDEAERLALMSSVPLDQCITCKSKETIIPDSPGIKERIPGTYTYRGQTFPCDCSAQIALRARYMLANIGYQYMTLDFASDWAGCPDTQAMVERYLRNWQNFKDQGIGLEFGGKNLGTGKTFAATSIGKELIKHNQKVFFLPFVRMVASFEREGDNIMDRMMTTTYLILDEVIPPVSARQHEFYATQLEALIRHRTNFNLPTIITTNMLRDELTEWYPRTYSLLSAKQIRVDVGGQDMRGLIGLDNIELAENGEVRPIT